MNGPLVHVLVINWNGREHLAECFDTLLAGTYRNVQYVLIDNGSEDDSVTFVRERYGADPRVAVVECGANLGWSGGNNVGLARALEAGADYVMLLNNDTATAPDAIAHLVAMAEADPRLGALAPKMLLYDNPALLNSVGLACSIIGSSWDLGIGRLDGPQWDEPRAVIGVCGGACLLRATALREAGLLPEDFGIYLDDLDLCLRIRDAGYEIRSCPRAVVRHKFSATMGEGKRARHKYYLNTRNRFYLMLRNFPVSQCARFLPALCAGECRALGRAVLDGEPWRIWAHARAWGAAAAYVPRALATRRRRKAPGAGFWPLIRTDRLFFEGTEFPKDGWYAERDLGGLRVRPMSARARLKAPEGRLRVEAVNCYPRLGAVAVDVRLNGTLVVSVTASERDECVIETMGGTLEFVAQRVFAAADTGERVDLGGWIRVERADGMSLDAPAGD